MVPNFFSSQMIFWRKKTIGHKICTHFLNLIFCAWLFVCLSVRQCLCKSPASVGQTKFWSNVLAPVLASDDTILEIFNFHNFNVFCIFWSTKSAVSWSKTTSKSYFFSSSFAVHWCTGLLGLENPIVDPVVQLNTKHSSVELS